MSNSLYLESKSECVSFTLTKHVNFTALFMCSIVKLLVSAVAPGIIQSYVRHISMPAHVIIKAFCLKMCSLEACHKS